MKSLKVLFAMLIMVVSFAACAPDNDEVAPDSAQNPDKFEVKNTEIGAEPQGGDK